MWFTPKKKNFQEEITKLLSSSSTDVTTKMVLVAGLRDILTKRLKEIRPWKNSPFDTANNKTFETACFSLRYVISDLSAEIKIKYFLLVGEYSKWSPNIYGDLFDECAVTIKTLDAHLAQCDAHRKK
jgi:hypothetical protein